MCLINYYIEKFIIYTVMDNIVQLNSNNDVN